MGLLAIFVSVSTGIFVVGLIAVVFLTAFLLSGIFGPIPAYEVSNKNQLPSNDSAEFLELLESLVDARVNQKGIVEVLNDGPSFYPAELNAIRRAERSVNLEAYIFQKSTIGREYLEAITERARAGIQVNILLDAFGSGGTSRAFVHCSNLAER